MVKDRYEDRSMKPTRLKEFPWFYNCNEIYLPQTHEMGLQDSFQVHQLALEIYVNI
jgi:hypothetical protein